MHLSAEPPRTPGPLPLAFLDRIGLIVKLALIAILAVWAEALLFGLAGVAFVVLLHRARRRAVVAELDRAKCAAYTDAEQLAKDIIAQRCDDDDQQGR
jgi:hypothetical protein